MTSAPAPRPRGSAATLITVAATGAELDKAAVPALPVTLDELVTTAKECQAAGAAVIHVHIRDADARPTLDLGQLTDTVQALREGTSLIVQLSTGGAVTDGFDRRLAVLDAAPDACSLTCGTVNFGDDVFANPWPFIRELYARTKELGVVPEFELFDMGQVATLHRLLDDLGGSHGGHVHWDARHPGPGGAGRGGPAAGGDLVGHRGGPGVAAGDAHGPGRRRPPAGRDGGHGHLRPRPPGHRQRRAG
jgi:beta-keto acid cleavage enzyme